MKTKEVLIRFINRKRLESADNTVYLYEDSLRDLGIPMDDIARTLDMIGKEYFINILKKYISEDAPSFWIIEVLPPCINYSTN